MKNTTKHSVYLAYKESYSGDGGTSIDFVPEGLFVEQGSSQETIKVDFDPVDHIDEKVYMVVVRYSSGDTFGQSYGHWYIEGLYLNQKDAEYQKKSVNDGTHSEEWNWTGYFERLESVSIYGTKINDGKCTGIKWF